jgi:hypothetical protein
MPSLNFGDDGLTIIGKFIFELGEGKDSLGIWGKKTSWYQLEREKLERNRLVAFGHNSSSTLGIYTEMLSMAPAQRNDTHNRYFDLGESFYHHTTLGNQWLPNVVGHLTVIQKVAGLNPDPALYLKSWALWVPGEECQGEICFGEGLQEE